MKEMLQLAQWWRGEWSDAHSEDDSRVSGSSVVATATNMNVSVAQRMPCARGSLKRWVVVQMRGPARWKVLNGLRSEMAGGKYKHLRTQHTNLTTV